MEVEVFVESEANDVSNQPVVSALAFLLLHHNIYKLTA